MLDDEYVQPAARGRPWFLLDHVRSGGRLPIVPLEEATVTKDVLKKENIARLAERYHDRAMLDHLVGGHRNESACPKATVLSANHAGALRHAEQVSKTFDDDSAAERGWLMAASAEGEPLVLTLEGVNFA